MDARRMIALSLPAALAAALTAFAAEVPGAPAPAFRQALASRLAGLDRAGCPAFAGLDGFFFLSGELRHYAAMAAEPPASPPAASTNALDAILDFNAQVRKAGARLIVVPVPGKTAVYPDRIDARLKPGPELNAPWRAALAPLESAGADAIDLYPAFLEMRKAGADSHCRQDAHWSPAAVKLAAARIAADIRREPWYAAVPKSPAKRTAQPIAFKGDIVGLLKTNAPDERATLEGVTLGDKPVESGEGSPVILIGDSHALVYHEPIDGGIAASGGGLLDQLAAELGFAPELVAVLGSGANAPRITLARRRDNLAGRKCIVWCFAARELTEAGQPWMRIPVVR